MAQVHLKQPTALQVADAILKKSRPDTGDYISHLKLQKLLYYFQGFHLAFFKKPLFLEKIYHWPHGPVVKTVYDKYKVHGSQFIEPNPKFDSTQFLSKPQLDLLAQVYDIYGQYSAFKLSEMTHNEAPWLQTVENEEISHDLLKKYFSTLVSDE